MVINQKSNRGVFHVEILHTPYIIDGKELSGSSTGSFRSEGVPFLSYSWFSSSPSGLLKFIYSTCITTSMHCI